MLINITNLYLLSKNTLILAIEPDASAVVGYILYRRNGVSPGVIVGRRATNPFTRPELYALSWQAISTSSQSRSKPGATASAARYCRVRSHISKQAGEPA